LPGAKGFAVVSNTNMRNRPSAVRIAAAIVATIGLAVLVWNVDRHGDHVQQGLISQLKHTQSEPVATPAVRADGPETTGLDLIDMYECMGCGTLPDIKGWVGPWLVTVMIGGVPTAILLRRNTA
jgi:hypothetical protein